MPTPETITLHKLRGALRKELMAEIGWGQSSGIKDTSKLYKTDAVRTAPNAPTSHFGLIKNNGKTLRSVFVRTGAALGSDRMMTEPRLLRNKDHNIKAYGPLVNRLHVRVNQVIERHTWRLIKFAYERSGVDTDSFRLPRKVWPFPTDTAKELFRRYLTEQLTDSFAELSSKHPVITDAALGGMFKSGNTFDAMNQVVLTKVVKGRGV